MRKTPQQVKEDFISQGVSVSEWARRHRFSRSLVVYVLGGGRALRGEAHDIAVALGLKSGTPRKEAPLRRAA